MTRKPIDLFDCGVELNGIAAQLATLVDEGGYTLEANKMMDALVSIGIHLDRIADDLCEEAEKAVLK